VAKRRFDPTRLLISLGLAAGVVLVVWGFATARTGDAAVEISDAAIENVYPKPGDIVLRQSEIKIDLVNGYRGYLVVNNQEIPVSDLVSTGGGPATPTFDAVYDPALSTVSFTPKQGATIENLPPDRNTVTAVYWKLDEGPERARSFTWSFKVS
jgi:hypothetical protein